MKKTTIAFAISVGFCLKISNAAAIQCKKGSCLISDSQTACENKLTLEVFENASSCSSYSYVCFKDDSSSECVGKELNSKIVVFNARPTTDCTEFQNATLGVDGTRCCQTNQCNTVAQAFTAINTDSGKLTCLLGECDLESTPEACAANLTVIPIGSSGLMCTAEAICADDACTTIKANFRHKDCPTQDDPKCCATKDCINIGQALEAAATFTPISCYQGACSDLSLEECKNSDSLDTVAVLTSPLDPVVCYGVKVDCGAVTNDFFSCPARNSTLRFFGPGTPDECAQFVGKTGVTSTCCTTNLCNNPETTYTKSPTKSPTSSPTTSPTTSPTKAPTRSPTKSPSSPQPAKSDAVIQVTNTTSFLAIFIVSLSIFLLQMS